MYQYRKGRLYAQRASFRIPDGFWVDTDPPVYYEDGISFSSPEWETSIDVYLFSGIQESVEEELLQYVKDVEDVFCEGPIPMKVGNLDGYCLFTGRDGFIDTCEICADISGYGMMSGNSELYDRLDILFCANDALDFHKFIASRKIRTFIGSVRVE